MAHSFTAAAQIHTVYFVPHAMLFQPQYSVLRPACHNIPAAIPSNAGGKSFIDMSVPAQALMRSPTIVSFVHNADCLLYQHLVNVLVPDVLRSIPSSLTQAVRNFAKSLEAWLTSALQGCPQQMQQVKVSRRGNAGSDQTLNNVARK